jgi:hypothetical protein
MTGKDTASLQSTLGNMGYSTTHCDQIPIGIGKLQLTCSYGVIGEIFDFGINNMQENVDQDYCMTTDANRGCEPSDRAKLQAWFDEAIGLEGKSYEITPEILWDADKLNSTCAHKENTGYVQYSCIQTPEMQ